MPVSVGFLRLWRHTDESRAAALTVACPAGIPGEFLPRPVISLMRPWIHRVLIRSSTFQVVKTAWAPAGSPALREFRAVYPCRPALNAASRQFGAQHVARLLFRSCLLRRWCTASRDFPEEKDDSTAGFASRRLLRLFCYTAIELCSPCGGGGLESNRGHEPSALIRLFRASERGYCGGPVTHGHTEMVRGAQRLQAPQRVERPRIFFRPAPAFQHKDQRYRTPRWQAFRKSEWRAPRGPCGRASVSAPRPAEEALTDLALSQRQKHFALLIAF